MMNNALVALETYRTLLKSNQLKVYSDSGPRQATILGMDKFSLLKEITEAPGDNRSESPYDE